MASARDFKAAFFIGPPGVGPPGCGSRLARPSDLRALLLEQLGQLVGDRPGQLFDVDQGDGAAVVAGDIVADADGDQLDRRSWFSMSPMTVAQVALQVVAGVHADRVESSTGAPSLK